MTAQDVVRAKQQKMAREQGTDHSTKKEMPVAMHMQHNLVTSRSQMSMGAKPLYPMESATSN